MAEDLPDAPWATKQPQQEELPDAPWAQPAKRTNTTIMDVGDIYNEMRGESQNQIGRGIEQLTTPTGGDLWESGKAAIKGVGNVGLGALGYVGSPIAAGIRALVGEPLEQRTGVPKEYSEFATSLATPGIGLPRIPGSTAPNVATKIAGPSTGKLAEEGRLLTKGGQETQAGMILEGAAKDPAAARGALGQVDEIVPGSKPTTFQASGDLGLGQLDRVAQTATRDAFIEREVAQNSARLRALREVQETGDPEAVANHLRARMQADDVAAEAAEQAAIARAEQQTQAAVRRAELAGQAAGGTNTPEIYGQILRRELDEANNAARTNERTLWQGVDPANRLSVNTAPVMNAEFRIYRDEMTQAGAASLTDAERRLGEVIQQYGQAVPFREMQDLRSLVSGTMRQELRLNGNSPAYARLSRLRGSIEESVSAPFEAGVPAGPGQAVLSAEAADRLAEATAATRARNETFKQQPIKGVLQREGAAGPYPLTNAAVPGRIIPSGPKGYDHVNAYLRAVQDRPGGGLQEVTDAMVADMRAHATAVDGTIDPNKLMGWAKSKQDALRAVTERDGGALVQRLGEVEDAGRGVKTATTDQARVVKEAAADRARQAKDAQVGAFGKLIGANNREDITRIVGRVVDPPPGTQAAQETVKNARALAGKLTTPEAQAGARRAIVEYVERKYVSNTAAGTDPTENLLRADQFQTFARDSAKALEEFGFTPKQIKTWQAISTDLRQAKQSVDATKVKGGSNTPQDMLAMKKFGLKSSLLGDIVYTVVGSGAGHFVIPIPIVGGAVGAAVGHLVHALRARGIQNVQQLVHEAMLDPAMAQRLLLKVEGKQKIAVMRTLGMWGERAARAEAITGSRHDQPEPSPKGYKYGGAVFPVGREGIKTRNKARAFEARERSALARSTPKAKGKVKYASGGFVPMPRPRPAWQQPRVWQPEDELREGEHDFTARGSTEGYFSQRRPLGSSEHPDVSYFRHNMPNVKPNVPGNERLGERTPLERRLNLNPLEQDYRRSFGAPATKDEAEDKPYPVYAEGGTVPYALDSPEFKEEVARGLAKNQDTIAKAQEFYPRVPLNDKAWEGFLKDAPQSLNIEDRRPGYRGGLRAAHRLARGGRVNDDSSKASKKSVDYSKGMPKAHCGICRFFSKGTCSKVKGTIYASMWCKLFKRKGKYQEGGLVTKDGEPIDEKDLANLPNPNAGPIIGVGKIVAPKLTEYLTEKEKPYEERLQEAGGSAGPDGQIIAPPSGKIPSTRDPREEGAAAEAVDLASSLTPLGGAKIAAAPILGVARRVIGKAPLGGGRSPGIYKDPREIAREASELVTPEHPAMRELFGVTREDLYGISQQGSRPGNLPDPAWTAQPERSRGSAAAEGVMNPANEQRLLDAMEEGGKHRGIQLADAWYVMDPAYQRLEYLHGPELAKRLYMRLNTVTSMTSPASGVWDELRRGTAANMMVHRGEFPRWRDWAGVAKKDRGPDFPPELREVPGHLAHKTAHAVPIENYLRRGSVQMDKPKVQVYIPASGVPETGFQTRWMVPDAHISKSLGMGDTRTPGTVGQGASMSMPEYRQIAPWYRERIAEPLGVEAVPAQARQWTLFGPQTGVRTMLGAPKLELLSQRIWERAKERGWDPKVLRDQVLSGGAHAGLAAGIMAPALMGERSSPAKDEDRERKRPPRDRSSSQ